MLILVSDALRHPSSLAAGLLPHPGLPARPPIRSPPSLPPELLAAAAGVLRPGVDWRRNLAALWFAQFTAIFGFSFAFPFLPVYLRQLGLHDTGQLALWSGLAGGASGAALAIMSPIWGVLADRYGRRAMLLRAMVGAGITVGLMGFARGPIDLVLLRLIQCATSGTVPAATALVASGTPRHRLGGVRDPLHLLGRRRPPGHRHSARADPRSGSARPAHRGGERARDRPAAA